MNHINLTIELCADDRARLDKILEALSGLQQPNCHSCVENAVGMTRGLAELAEKATAPEPVNDPEPTEEPELAEEPEPTEEPAEAPKYTKADVQAIVQRLAAPTSKKREQAKAIVKEYAVKISAIPADKYDEVMGKLIELDKLEA